MLLTVLLSIHLFPLEFRLPPVRCLNPLWLEDCLAKRRVNIEYFQGEGRDHIARGVCSIVLSFVCSSAL